MGAQRRRFRGYRPASPKRDQHLLVEDAGSETDSVDAVSSTEPLPTGLSNELFPKASDRPVGTMMSLLNSCLTNGTTPNDANEFDALLQGESALYEPDGSIKADSSLSSCSSSSNCSSVVDGESETMEKTDEIGFEVAVPTKSSSSFLMFRLNYLFVTLVTMLADGMQGTHLYVLYEGYGYSVASLYCLGFITGAVTAPITGPLIDKFGRKKSAILYCVLEIGINMLEQYPFLSGLILSRVVGGITTNLLNSVFETWLDTEYRERGFDKEKYEIVMRDSVVVSNLAAIASGYVAHTLAERLGPVGPFKGAVTSTGLALVVVMLLWTENYGSTGDDGKTKSVKELLTETVQAFQADSKVLRVGIIQGLTMGSVQIFIFLWSPCLQGLAKTAMPDSLGLDGNGAPAFGLIFGAYMTAGVIGGLFSPLLRQLVTKLLAPLAKPSEDSVTVEGEVRPMAVEFLAAFCYMLCALLLFVPCLLSDMDSGSFSVALSSFVLYEFMVGLYSPCEGVIRSLYIPSDSRASMMTLPCIIVNLAVAFSVAATNFISIRTAYCLIAFLMATSAVLQISLLSKREWQSLFGRVDNAVAKGRSLSLSFKNKIERLSFRRSSSMPCSTVTKRTCVRSQSCLTEVSHRASMISSGDAKKAKVE